MESNKENEVHQLGVKKREKGESLSQRDRSGSQSGAKQKKGFMRRMLEGGGRTLALRNPPDNPGKVQEARLSPSLAQRNTGTTTDPGRPAKKNFVKANMLAASNTSSRQTLSS